MIFQSPVLDAVSSTVLITVIPISFVFMMPAKGNLRLWLAFAVGGLLGDAFLHLIPHALESGHDHHTKFNCNEATGVCVENSVEHEHHHEHNHGDHHEHESHEHDELRRRLHAETHEHEHDHKHDLSQGLWIIAGLISFFCLDKYVRSLDNDGHGHSHGHTEKVENTNHGNKPDLIVDTNVKANPGYLSPVPTNNTNRKKMLQKTPKLMHLFFDQEKKNEIKARSEVKPATIILNLLGDFAHNFTDGLAIGGSWSISPELGLSTTFAIMFHEIPHEVADFAILLQAGLTKTEVVRTQLLTGGGALIGTIIGVLLHTMEASSWIPNFTAGGFIYIACANVIPELLNDCTMMQTVQEVLIISIGIGFMIAITYFE